LLGYSAVDAHGEREFYWMLATSIGSPQRLRPYDCLVTSVVVLPMLFDITLMWAWVMLVWTQCELGEATAR